MCVQPRRLLNASLSLGQLLPQGWRGQGPSYLLSPAAGAGPALTLPSPFPARQTPHRVQPTPGGIVRVPSKAELETRTW